MTSPVTPPANATVVQHIQALATRIDDDSGIGPTVPTAVSTTLVPQPDIIPPPIPVAAHRIFSVTGTPEQNGKKFWDDAMLIETVPVPPNTTYSQETITFLLHAGSTVNIQALEFGHKLTDAAGNTYKYDQMQFDYSVKAGFMVLDKLNAAYLWEALIDVPMLPVFSELVPHTLIRTVQYNRTSDMSALIEVSIDGTVYSIANPVWLPAATLGWAPGETASGNQVDVNPNGGTVTIEIVDEQIAFW
jgi:hypothetical protein